MFLVKKPHLIPFALKYFLEENLFHPDRVLKGSNLQITNPKGQWQSLSDFPTYRYEFGGTYLNEKIYVIGGLTASSVYNVTSLCEVFDVKNQTWSKIKRFPKIIHHPSVTNVNNNVYVIGGNGLRITPYNSAYVFSPEINEWRQLANMPTARGALGIAPVNDIIYAIGGGTNKVAQDANEAYDYKTNTWRKCAPMLTKREHHAVASCSGLVFAFGGYTKSLSECLNINECYNPQTDTWETRTPVPLNISGFSVCTVGKSIFLFGGEQGWSVSGECLEYKVDEDKWYRRANMPTKRYASIAVNVDNKVHVLGGNSVLKGYRFCLAHEIFTPNI